jgi:hypothetical protein
MEPDVNDSANFEGAMTSIGRKRKNARKKNTAAPQRRAAKYTKSVPEGIRKLHRGNTVDIDSNPLAQAESVNERAERASKR